MLGATTLLLTLAACGGGDDDTDSAATTTTVVAVAPTSSVAPVTTAPASTTTLPAAVVYVTDGATVVVANASGINGAAGRLTDRLARVGFTTTDAVNSAESVSNLAVTQIHYDPAVDGAQAVAESLKQALGGGDIEVVELEIPALTESGDLGDADVLVLMGDDVADKTLDELQGVTTPADDTTSGDDSSAEDTADGSGG